MDIVKAVELVGVPPTQGRIADVQFALQHAPEKVNDKDNRVLVLLHTHAADYGCGTGWEHRSVMERN